MITDEWVRQLNKLGQEMDKYFFAVHPSAWETDLYLMKLKERYLKLAKVQPEDEVQPIKIIQLSFLDKE